MPMPNFSFLFGVIVLLYFGTFILFALLRIVTGVSIQRISFRGLRRIAYAPRDGVSIQIRGIGISLHRPTFTQPSYLSLTITEPQLVIDLEALHRANHAAANGHSDSKSASPAKPPSKEQEDHGRVFSKLIEWKERVKKLHRQIHWLRLFDLTVLGASCQIKDVGSIRLERLMLAVDTRLKAIDRDRLFQHSGAEPTKQRPAEWRFVLRGLLLTTEGKDPMELMDYCTMSIHGFLSQELDGLRDASIALKFGRLSVPFDDLEKFTEHVENSKPKETHHDMGHGTPVIQQNGVPIDDSDLDPLEENAFADSSNDAKKFASSILHGIHEVQLAVGAFALSKRVKALPGAKQSLYLNVLMKEVGLDLTRLDPQSPAHRQYFSPKDISHQALLTAISMSAGIDDGLDHPERMLYIPMLTATVKTTHPFKLLQASKNITDNDRNGNILFANLVCTSPSVDLDPKHLPLLLVLTNSDQSNATSKHPEPRHKTSTAVYRLLPKAIVNIAIQEPVIRVSLPRKGNTKEYDMIISSVSTMSMDIDAQHNVDHDTHYALFIDYRHTNHRLYGQSNDGVRHELLFADTVEFKVDVNALPQTTVIIGGKLNDFSLYLTEPEICEGIRRIILSIRKESQSHHSPAGIEDGSKVSFLRRAPAWLQHVHIEGSDFDVEVAGVEPSISKYARGVSFHLNSWSVEHKINRDEVYPLTIRRRSTSKPTRRDSSPKPPHSEDSKRRRVSPTDGRRLAVHVEGLEGLLIDSINETTGDPFLALPKFEVAFSTSTDAHGPLLHVNSAAEKLYVLFSLYHVACLGNAVLLAKKTFAPPPPPSSDKSPPDRPTHPQEDHPTTLTPNSKPQMARRGSHDDNPEMVAVDFRAGLVQVKASMPADPALMLQIYGVEAGQHRWANPFMRTKLTRLYAATPGMQAVWSRIVSVKTARFDLRSMNRKVDKHMVSEKSFDVSAEGIRIGVPHQLVVHAIFDNIINVIKTSEQLHHNFVTGNSDSVLTKHPEGPKHIPKITIRSQVFIFELEDSPFEYKLGMIHRIGLIEQRQRMAREQAFNLKAKKILNKRPEKDGQARSRSLRPSDEDHKSDDKERSRSANARAKHRHAEVKRNLRYDTEGKCDMAGSTTRTIDEARDALHRFNAESWKKRIDRAWTQRKHAMKEVREIFAAIDGIAEEDDETENIMALTLRPGLASLVISDLGVTIDKPTFPLKDLPVFMNKVGKGMPLDMKYGLLVPLHLHITMGEAAARLRDYPLPLLSIPAIRAGQSARLPSLSLTTNFVVAEEFQGIESQRHVKVMVVPKHKLGPDDVGDGYTVDVIRTVSPVKTYSDMKVDINTSGPTRITWGTSYQPAIQDMMQVIEGFTKPPMDPSEPVGFWDKIRLSFHSRLLVSWKGDGDVHLNLKGSRDPYIVTGDGAGFVMVWRNNVVWKIGQDEDPRKFLSVDSGDYILAVPDYDLYARTMLDMNDDSNDDASVSTGSDSTKSTAMFKKVVMKLSGNVQWLLGLMFEQSTGDDKRSFDFKPHYEVVLKHPDFVKREKGKTYDAFRGFRSQHIHMSVAIAAPQSRDWNVLNTTPSDNYNSVHLTPRFFTHFFKWWSLFSGVMSLPVRQGALWGGRANTSKKFGRHLATLKYNLLLSPLYIAHIYKHKEIEDYSSDTVSATGLKMKIDSFMLDLHQRREFFQIPTQQGGSKTTSGMKMNQGQVDFISADFRAVSASIKGTSMEDIENAEGGVLSSHQSAADMSRFTIPDNDFRWIDMDDFVEFDWILPQESNPETKILPLGFTPRFTYFRQTEHGDSISGDDTRSSPFGDEPTHFCIMTQKNDPRRVQADLCEARLAQIADQIKLNHRAIGEQEVKVAKDSTNDESIREKLRVLKDQSEVLRRKHAFLHGMLKEIHNMLGTSPQRDEPALDRRESDLHDEHMAEGLKSIPSTDESKDFNNRFVVHNAQIKWNNSLRNIILRYIHQVSQRRGFVYYMSRRAVKFILDIMEEKKQAKEADGKAHDKHDTDASQPLSPQPDDEMTIEARIEQILADGRAFVEADDGGSEDQSSSHAHSDEICADFMAQNSYHFRLVAPQIQLQSEKNPKSVVLITAKGMYLKVVQIMDKDRLMDDISGLVQRRFSAAMDSMQVFVTSTKTFSTDYLHLYSGNRYGTKAGTYWPPWVPVEVMYVFSVNPYGFSRVVQRTSASLKLDKYNQLRLKNDDVSQGRGKDDNEGPEHRLDHLTIEFPQFRAICDSSQYFAMYIIVIDLLLYSEPLEKDRTERLEKILLASDFSDLTGAPELVETLQARIRQLEEIKMHFEIHENFLDLQGWKDRIQMDHDLTHCEDELFFMMKAITTSQQKAEDRSHEARRGVLHWYIMAKELAWHLVGSKEQKFLEFQIRDTSFERTDNSDGSNQNTIECGRINGYNFLPNALYRELIAPYIDEKEGVGDAKAKMLRVQWLMLEAIAGIPVVDYFEVELVPLQVQLERNVAKKLFEYIFPGTGGSAFEGSGLLQVKKMLPVGDDSENDDDDSSDQNGPMSTAPEPALPPGEEDEAPTEPGTGPGCLERRLQPTLRLVEGKQPTKKGKSLGMSNPSAHSSHWSLFQHRNKSQLAAQSKSNGNLRASTGNLAVLTRTPSNNSFEDSRSVTDKVPNSPASTRKSHDQSRTTHKSKSKEDDKNQSDDLTQMLSRASSYMTLSYFHIHSLILCLSYKGQGKRNIEDVHDLVFRLPSIEYRNKTWSNLDLAVEMKREVIRALIAQAGRIVSNKFRTAPKHRNPARAADSLLLGAKQHEFPGSSRPTSTLMQRLASLEEDISRNGVRDSSSDGLDADRDATRIRTGNDAASTIGSADPDTREGSFKNGVADAGSLVPDESKGSPAPEKRSSAKASPDVAEGKEKKSKGRRLWRFSTP